MSTTSDSNPAPGPIQTVLLWIGGIISMIVWIVAIFLSFKCNDGFNAVQFVLALCCPYCYLPYGIWCAMKSGGLGLGLGI